MSSKVKADITELNNINNEIKRLSEQLKPLRERKKTIESNILAYMKTVGEEGCIKIKLNNLEVVTVEKKVREKMSKDEKEQTAVQLLQQTGVNNPKKTYKDLQEMLKGKEKSAPALKVKQN